MAQICAVQHGFTVHSDNFQYGSITGTGTTYIEYWLSSDTYDYVIVATRAVLRAVVIANTEGGKLFPPSGSCSFYNTSSSSYWTINGSTYYIPTGNANVSVPTGGQIAQKETIVSSTYYNTIYKTHSVQTIGVSACYNPRIRVTNSQSDNNITNTWDSEYPSGAFNISAKTSWTVSYNLNGASGSIANQTKWYNETLTLTTYKPKRDGYIFRGWARDQAHANAGDANQGATYVDNASITLYAVWELAYQKPTIKNSSVERCLSDGSLEDEGKYALVTFDWSIYKTDLPRYLNGNTYPYANNHVTECKVAINGLEATKTLTGESGTDSVVVGNDSFDSDTAYETTISITDSQEIVTDNTTILKDTLPTQFFPMDFNADATSAGFFMPAPNDSEGAYFGKDIIASNDIYLTIDTNAGEGVDYDLYTALDNLDWEDILT